MNIISKRLHKTIFSVLLIASLLLSVTVPALATTTDTLVQCSSSGTVTDYTAITSVSLPVTFNSSSDYYSTVDVAVYTGGSAVYQLTSLVPGTDGKVTINLGAVTKYAADTVYEIQYRGHYYVYGEDTQLIDSWQSSNLYFKVEAAAVNGAALSPTSATFDLNSPADVSTAITWNSASSVTGVKYGTASLTLANDYTVSSSVLLIKSSYLDGLNLSAGDTAKFDVTFDTGAAVTLTVDIANNYTKSTVATLDSLKVGGSEVSGFDSAVTTYNVELPYGTQPGSAAATVSATASDSKATVSVTQAAILPGSANIYVIAEDTVATKTYIVNFTNGSANTHTISVSNDGNGTGSANFSSAATGTTVTLSSMPNSGYHFKEWQIIIPSTLSVASNTFTMPDEAVLLKAVFEADTGSGSSSSHSGSSSSESRTEINTTTANDITTASTEITAVAASDGTGTAAVTEKQMQDAIDAAVKEAEVQATKAVVALQIDTDDDAAGISVSIPQAALQEAASSGIQAFEITAPQITVSFDSTALRAINKNVDGDFVVKAIKASDMALSNTEKSLVGSRPIYQLSVKSGSTTISDFGGGTATVSIPYTPASGEDANKIVIYYITGDGQLIAVPNCVYDASTKMITFTTKHFSAYAIGYNDVSFTDVSGWYQDYVNYLAAREIINGTSDTEFSPGANITRAQFVTILARMSGDNLSGYTSSSFSDVATSNWYSSAVQWAYKNGVATGSDGKFAPSANITREQMATMLYHYAKYAGIDLSEDAGMSIREFSDYGSISTWAAEPVQWAASSSIISGNRDGSFAPAENATRAQAAKVIALLLQDMMK